MGWINKTPSVAPSKRPWWLEDALAVEGQVAEAPPLREDREVDVAIVGGGYTGLWTALHLKERDPSLRIAIVESDIVGWGASGRNGGVSQGYWVSLDALVDILGMEEGLRLARQVDAFIPRVRELAAQHDYDVQLNHDGYLKLSASPVQDASVENAIKMAEGTGVPDMVTPISARELPEWIKSPTFRRGAFFKDGMTLQPARLCRLLRKEVLAQGIELYESTPMTNLVEGRPYVVETPYGRLRAPEVVMARNAWQSDWKPVRNRITNFGSYVAMTEPVPELLKEIGWTNGMAMTDCRMFLHYFRTTPEGRVIMGSASGPMGFRNKVDDRFFLDGPTVARAEMALRRLLPGLDRARVTHGWGGAVDVCSDHWPFYGTAPGTRLHYIMGYSGQGVCQSWVLAQGLASSILGRQDEWTSFGWFRRTPPWMPPEPARRVVGGAVRMSILATEYREDEGKRGNPVARAVAAIPKLVRMEIGTR